MRAGAQGYICIDDVTVDGQDSVFDHAVKRARMQQSLSENDVTVLSILKNIKDGVIVVDSAGHVLDMHQRVVKDFGLKPQSVEWITAWDLK